MEQLPWHLSHGQLDCESGAEQQAVHVAGMVTEMSDGPLTPAHLVSGEMDQQGLGLRLRVVSFERADERLWNVHCSARCALASQASLSNMQVIPQSERGMRRQLLSEGGRRAVLYLAVAGSRSQTAGCDMAAVLMTAAYRRPPSKHSARPSPVARFTCDTSQLRSRINMPF